MGPKLPTIGVGQTGRAGRRDARHGAGAARAVGRPAAERAHPHRHADATSRRSPASECRWVSSTSSRAGASRPARCTPARQPDPATGAVVTPISLARRSPRTASASTRASSTRAAATRRAPRSRRASPRSRRRGHGLAFASGLAAEDNVLRLARAGRPGPARQRRLRRHVPADLQGVRTARAAVDGGRPHRPRRARRRAGRPTPRWCGWRRRPTRCSRASTSRRSPTSPTSTARSSSSTTRSPRRTCSSRSRSAPTSSCTRPRSTSAATATWSAASSPLDDDELAERLRFTQNAAGAVPAPFDCYLVLRGVKTLAVRMDRHCANARADRRPARRPPRRRPGAVPAAARPSRPRRRGQADARLRRHGQLHAARRRGGGAARSPRRTELFTLAESLGAVESLIEHPGAMTHASVAGSPLEVPDDLVRLSVGIESAADLVADLEQALASTCDPGAHSSSPPTACR